jgi:hypothetical protein
MGYLAASQMTLKNVRSFVFLLAAVTACASPAGAEERVLGLLALPEVFGNGACDRFSPEDVALYATPGRDQPVGAVHVVENWTFHNDGGCAGLLVAVRLNASTGVQPLPTREYAYEEPGALVVDRRGSWFKVRLAEGAAWVQASARDKFYPLEDLLENGLTYLTGDWDGQLRSRPGAHGRPARTAPRAGELSVKVLESLRVKGELWFNVQVMSHSACDAGGEPNVVDSGWVPAYGPSGEPSIWFYSRGC